LFSHFSPPPQLLASPGHKTQTRTIPKKNTRDRDDQSQTATDQSNEAADIKITADIRKMVVNDDSLSMMAKNVKIITSDGVVTLRGPVETEKEKAAIESHAKHGGAKKITNELEIKKS
jgi:hyperosmotically inducible protein